MCNIFFDVVLELDDTIRLGDQIVSTYMYRIKHSDARRAIVNLDNNYVKIMFRDGEVRLKFRDNMDMLRFAKALYDVVLDMIVDDDLRIVEGLGMFLKLHENQLGFVYQSGKK